MKLVLRTQLPLLAILAASPLACSTDGPDLPINDLCAQMGLDRYEFLPVGVPPIGSFEPAAGANKVAAVEGTLMADDDDLTDDYPIFLKGKKLYEDELRPKYEAEIEIFENLDPEKEATAYTEAESAALEKLRSEMSPLLVEVCKFYVLPAVGRSPAPTFLNCKDKWNEPGDGVVASYGLDDKPAGSQDAALGACTTVTGTENAYAINAWGPVSTFKTDIGQEVPYDGFTYSGITVPLFIAPYTFTSDASEWEGVAFWARLADADEAVSIDSEQVINKPARYKEGQMAQPMDGVGQLGVIIQTIDTAAFADGLDAQKFRLDSVCPSYDADGNPVLEGTTPVTVPCFPTQKDFDDFDAPEQEDATGKFKYGVGDAKSLPVPVPQPFCIDYSPVDAIVGEEAPFRNQCWDGFRTMKDISRDWKFYFFPFKEMRQAGWGQVASSFRVDQIRSVNLLTSAFQSMNIIVDEASYYRRKK